MTINRAFHRSFVAALLSAGLAMSAFLLAGCSTAGPGSTTGGAAREPAPRALASTAEDLGIEIVALRLTAAGAMLDLRYKVVDPAKARAFLKRGAHPYLLDPQTGAKLTVPSAAYVGALRQTAVLPVAGKTYFMFFRNAARTVEAGRKVTLVMGDRRIEGLVVT